MGAEVQWLQVLARMHYDL